MSSFRIIASTRRWAKHFASLTDAELRSHSLDLKYDAMCQRLSSRRAEAFGLVTEALRRRLNLIPYDVQLLGGIRMADGAICEMKTGEGKTFTAALTAYCLGLSGLGCHVVTVNDYLARRDHELLQPVYKALGLSSGVITAELPSTDRQKAYGCDITYGTAKELGFDFLRDRIAHASDNRPSLAVQRDLNAVLIDEADSILLDEARTPLVIGNADHEAVSRHAECYGWAAQQAADYCEGSDFEFDEQQRKVHLTRQGIQRMMETEQRGRTRDVSFLELREFLERAIFVRRNFHRDTQYAVVKDDVVIIDEFTGRPAEGRKWQKGVHQAIEAKEGLDVSPHTDTAASMTLQWFFRLYPHTCGMTGTGLPARREFRQVYGKRVIPIPTHRPVARSQLTARVYRDNTTKFAAVVEQTRNLLQQGRAVLIGTRSVEHSEMVSELLYENGIEHSVLNARHLEEEAAIVAGAGQVGAVTVATNMAGRGTDIALQPEVRERGGLHVVLTEIHESERIDLQLIGRCGRQGDPGSYGIHVSLDDEILSLGYGETRAETIRRQLARDGDRNGRLAGRGISLVSQSPTAGGAQTAARSACPAEAGTTADGPDVRYRSGHLSRYDSVARRRDQPWVAVHHAEPPWSVACPINGVRR